jgi:xanthine dehydrogenase accessory factor
VAQLVFRAGLPVVVLERAEPLAVRRRVSFAAAVWDGDADVEGVRGLRVGSADEAEEWLGEPTRVPLLVDPEARCLERLRPAVLVDARMRKTASAITPRSDRFAVGLGPGFVAGKDVDAVVETQRGPELGRMIWSGSAQADSAVPTPVQGIDVDRVIRAPASGAFRSRVAIGDLVERGQLVGDVGGTPTPAPIGGLVRGLLAEGVRVEAGVKIGDIDPRGARIDPGRISDKGRAVAAGVLEAVLTAAPRPARP